MAARVSASPLAAAATAAANTARCPADWSCSSAAAWGGGEVEDVVEGGLGVGGAAGEPVQEVGEVNPWDVVDDLAHPRERPGCRGRAVGGQQSGEAADDGGELPAAGLVGDHGGGQLMRPDLLPVRAVSGPGNRRGCGGWS
jgi:hypothetical protein